MAGNYYGNRHSLRLLAFGGHEITYQAWEGVPAEIIDTNRTYNPYTYDNQVDDYRQNHYQLHYGYQLASRLTLKLGLHYTKGSGFYEQYQTNQDLASYGLNNTTVYNTANGDTTLITNTDLVRRKSGTMPTFSHDTPTTTAPRATIRGIRARHRAMALHRSPTAPGFM